MKIRIEKQNRVKENVWKAAKGFALGLAIYAFFNSYKDIYRLVKIHRM